MFAGLLKLSWLRLTVNIKVSYVIDVITLHQLIYYCRALYCIFNEFEFIYHMFNTFIFELYIWPDDMFYFFEFFRKKRLFDVRSVMLKKISLRWVKANILKVEVKVKVVDRAREEVEGSTGLGEEEDGEEEDTTVTMATGVEEVII